MIYFTQEAQEKLDKLFYYPYTFGKHLDKANRDLHSIEMSIPHLPLRIGTHSITIRGIGSFTYLCNGKDIFIQFITWSTLLTSFYYKKSNFIVFTSSSNIASVHPALYTDRNEPSFKCDNGFKVVSRYVTIRSKRTEVFNFKDLSGNIICDIDFTQVKPFDEYKDMTARGYTPDRRCYMVFEDGYKEEVNESRSNKFEQLINECVDRCLREYLVESIHEHRETLYRCYNEEICKTKWIWLSDFEDNAYGVNVATFSIPLNKLKIADYDTTLKYIQKYDIKSFQDAMYDEYIEMGMDMFDWKSYEDGKITDEQAYNQITRLSWTEVMEHPQDYTFTQHLEKDGFDGYCFNYLDSFQGCPMYYAFFNKNTLLKYRIS